MHNILPLKVHRSESEWRELYEEHVSAGTSMSSFCKSKSIPISSYIKWYRKYSTSPVLDKSPKFKELVKERVSKEEVIILPNKLELELDFGSGIILRISK